LFIAASCAILLQVVLEDLVNLYMRVFERILNREDAKTSPYARYYLATSNPLVWKDIATSMGKTLKNLRKIEDAAPLSIPVTAVRDPNDKNDTYV